MADKNTPVKKAMNNRGSHFLMILLLVFLAIAIIYSFGNLNTPVELRSDEFEEMLTDAEVASINITPLTGDNNFGAYKVTGTLDDTRLYITYLANETDYIYVTTLIRAFNNDADPANDIAYDFIPAATYNLLNIIFPIVLVAGIVVMLVFMMRGSNNSNKQAFDFGKSRARLSKNQKTTFDDVAGADEEKAELAEIIDFLKNPKKYMELGARIPKGVLLVGPPGTGKTLIARAVAGEANECFTSTWGTH